MNDTSKKFLESVEHLSINLKILIISKNDTLEMAIVGIVIVVASTFFVFQSVFPELVLYFLKFNMKRGKDYFFFIFHVTSKLFNILPLCLKNKCTCSFLKK